MRIKLTLQSNEELKIPFNYQYRLSASVYKLLNISNEAYATFLHNEGYKLGNKKYKLFTYSSLLPTYYKIREKYMMIAKHNPVYLYISSLKEEFLLHLTSGLFKMNHININNQILKVVNVEVVKPPKFTNKMKFKCLSPVVITTMKDINGKLKSRDISITEPLFTKNLRKNILQKYELIYNKMLPDDTFNVFYRDEDIKKYQRGKLIEIKRVDDHVIKIKGYLCPFTVEGNPDLLELMWHVGAGEKNALGFGMVGTQ